MGTVNMNIKGLVGHKGGSKIFTLRGGIIFKGERRLSDKLWTFRARILTINNLAFALVNDFLSITVRIY